jgi:hypothetical protein
VFILSASACLAAIAVLCARIVVTAAFERTAEKKSFSLAVHWVHPRIARAAFDTLKNETQLWLFGRLRMAPGPSRQERGDFYDIPTPPPEGAAVPKSSGKIDSLGEDEPVSAGSHEVPSEPAPLSEPEGTTEAVGAAKKVPLREKLRGAIAKMKKSAWMRAVFFIGQASWRSKILRWLARCTAALPRLVKLHAADMHIRAGFSDPAATGRLFGYWTGFCGAVAAEKKLPLSLTIDPVFTEACLFVRGSVSVQSSLMRFLTLFAVAVATFPYFSTIKTWRASRR